MTSDNKTLEFIDTTLRDGPQSNWGMRMSHGMQESVIDEMDQAGFSAIELPMGNHYVKMAYRFFNENPWDTFRMWKTRITKTDIQFTAGLMAGMLTDTPPQSMIKWHSTVLVRNCGWNRTCFMANTGDEITRFFPWMIPHVRSLGHAIIIDLVYTVSPRHTDKYYTELTRKCMKWKPEGIKIKDVDGLLTPERARTLIPAIQKESKDIPIEMHCHCASTHAPEVFMEAMKLGVMRFHTAVPPLAYGTGHPSIFNTINNAKYLGLAHHINLEPLKSVEKKLTRIAKQEGLMIGAPVEYDYGHYVHMVPGGVMGTLKFQLEVAGLSDKLEEVLEEVPRIVKDLGYPIMITPYSQFIVAQATINVATGERYKEILDAMIDFALGVYGVVDTGQENMDQNVKDMFLSAPNAKQRKKRYEIEQQNLAEDPSVEKIKQKYGMANASDEDFFDYYFLGGDEEIRKFRASGAKHRTWYTGKEPLVLLLKELSKEKDISRLTMQKGNSFFEFRQK